MRLLIVGEDFPGPVPVAPDGGGVFEVLQDGSLCLVIQMPNPNAAEAAALREGFSSYSLYVCPQPPHVAIWVWKFGTPVGYMETPFHAGVYRDDRMKTYQCLPSTENALTVVTLDNKKIAALRVCGLRHDAIAHFHAAIEKQQQYPLDVDTYRQALEREYDRTAKENYLRGTSWKHHMDV